MQVLRYSSCFVQLQNKIIGWWYDGREGTNTSRHYYNVIKRLCRNYCFAKKDNLCRFVWVGGNSYSFYLFRQVTRNEHTAEEDAGLVANFNAPFFQRGIRRSKDNTTAGRNLRTEIYKRYD